MISGLDPELLAEWEARLAGEGLAAIPDRVAYVDGALLVGHGRVEQATSSIDWASGAGSARLGRVLRALAELRLREPGAAELLDGYYLRGASQPALAMRYGVTQPSIHLRLRRALRLVRLAALLPSWSADEAVERVHAAAVEPVDRRYDRIYAAYWSRPNQHRVARQLGVTRGHVAWALGTMQRAVPPTTQVGRAYGVLGRWSRSHRPIAHAR